MRDFPPPSFLSSFPRETNYTSDFEGAIALKAEKEAELRVLRSALPSVAMAALFDGVYQGGAAVDVFGASGADVALPSHRLPTNRCTASSRRAACTRHTASLLRGSTQRTPDIHHTSRDAHQPAVTHHPDCH